MSQPRVMLATICLNEMQWLPKLVEQHRDWPGLVKWVFVEAADAEYAKANPTLVSPSGFSVDGTHEYLDELCRNMTGGLFHHTNLSGDRKPNDDPAQGKCELRNRYLEVAERVKPDFIVILDADEFYAKDDQRRINEIVAATPGSHAWRLRQREIWRPPVYKGWPYALFSQEVTGGYWNEVHTRIFRWSPGISYCLNHNWPCDRDRVPLIHKALVKLENSPEAIKAKYDIDPPIPQYVHMAAASTLETRRAKTDYYVGRGEGPKDGRQRKIDCWRAWETWRPGDSLPHDATAKPYDGPVPECFR